MSALLVFLLVSLASLQQIAAAASPHQVYLHHETEQTLQTLSSLPSHCTGGLDSLIHSKQSALPSKVFYCSISSIVIDLAEVLVDTAYFGFEAYVAAPALWDDLKGLRKCLNETTVKEKATCALEYLPGAVQAAEVIVGCLENYVGEMEMIVPLLWDEIQQCRESSVSQYKHFLESELLKANTCAQQT